MYKVLLLKTGDTILAELDKDLEDFSYNPTIDLINPVKIVFLRGELKGIGIEKENIAIKPFLNLSDSERFPVSTDVIVTLGDMKASARKLYLDYVKKTRLLVEQEAVDDAILDLFKSIVPAGTPILVIEHDDDERIIAQREK